MPTRIKIEVMPKAEVLDPQGRTVRRTLQSLGFGDVEDVTIGRLIEVKVASDEREKATASAQQMCERLLVNDVIEDYRIRVEDPA